MSDQNKNTKRTECKKHYIRNCQSCGGYTFVIHHDYRLICFECDEPFNFADQPENWEPSKIHDGIDKSLAMLAELFPWKLSYSVDREGLALLRTAINGCQGDVRLTDLGGGPLTNKHLEIVFGHVGHAEVAVWLNDPSDVGLIRATCAAVNATLKATASCCRSQNQGTDCFCSEFRSF